MADPRLTDLSLLSLAAMRVRRRRQVPDWPRSVGLASLLDAARVLPKRSPWEMPDLDTSTALGQLLAEARQRQKERDHGA